MEPEIRRHDFPRFADLKARVARGPELTALAQPGEVLGFYTVGFLLERPDGGGAVTHRLKVPNMPAGTQRFHVFVISQTFHFFDKPTGESIERPLWIIHTDVFASKTGEDWYIEVSGGWADKGDTTHWEGIVGVTGIAVG